MHVLWSSAHTDARGTTAEAYVRQHTTLEPMQISESNEELYASLAAGGLDAVIDDSPIADWFFPLCQNYSSRVSCPGPKRLTQLWSTRGTTNCGQRLIRRLKR